MRRVIALLMMLLMPLQFAWSASHAVSGHADKAGAISVSHAHDGHHHPHDGALAGDQAFPDSGHAGDPGDDGDNGSHYHPVFTLIVIEPDLRLEDLSAAGPPIHPPASFTPHFPPLHDWPPSARI